MPYYIVKTNTHWIPCVEYTIAEQVIYCMIDLQSNKSIVLKANEWIILPVEYDLWKLFDAMASHYKFNISINNKSVTVDYLIYLFKKYRVPLVSVHQQHYGEQLVTLESGATVTIYPNTANRTTIPNPMLYFGNENIS